MPASKTAPAVAMQAFSPVDEAALQQIRKTAAPPRVSVLDVIKVITRLSTNNCSVIWNRLHERHPEVITSTHKFPGARQKQTHVADARAICEIVMLLPGNAAADFRKRTAEVLVRFLGGDRRAQQPPRMIPTPRPAVSNHISVYTRGSVGSG